MAKDTPKKDETKDGADEKKKTRKEKKEVGKNMDNFLSKSIVYNIPPDHEGFVFYKYGVGLDKETVSL